MQEVMPGSQEASDERVRKEREAHQALDALCSESRGPDFFGEVGVRLEIKAGRIRLTERIFVTHTK